MKEFGLLLILAGLGIAAFGGFIMFADKIPFLGQLPGDIRIHKEKTSFFFPITSCIVLSIILTVVINLAFRVLGK